MARVPRSGHAGRRVGLPRKRPKVARPAPETPAPETPADVEPLPLDGSPPPEGEAEWSGPAAQCAKCEAEVAPGAAIPLWDSRKYCRDCVEEACPGMADYALEHPVLEEDFHYSGKRMLRGWLRHVCTMFPIIWLAWATFYIGIGVLTGYQPVSEAPEALLTLTLVLLAVLPGALLASAGFSLGGLPRKIRVGGGQATVIPTGELPYLLEHGAWMTATCRYARRGRSLPADKAIVLIFSSAVSRHHNYACGCDEKMYGIWRGFLELADVPRARTPRPFLDGLMCWGVFLVAGAIAAVPGLLAGWLVDYLLETRLFEVTQFKGTLALAGGVMGGLIALRYFRLWLRGLRIRRARDPWIATALSAMFGYGFLAGAAIVAGATRSTFWSFLAATLVTVIVGLAGFAIGWHTWRRSVQEDMV